MAGADIGNFPLDPVHRLQSAFAKCGLGRRGGVYVLVEAGLLKNVETGAVVQCLAILGVVGHLDHYRLPRVDYLKAQVVLGKLFIQLAANRC